MSEAAVMGEAAPAAGEAPPSDPAPAGADGTDAAHTDSRSPWALLTLGLALQAADGFGARSGIARVRIVAGTSSGHRSASSSSSGGRGTGGHRSHAGGRLGARHRQADGGGGSGGDSVGTKDRDRASHGRAHRTSAIGAELFSLGTAFDGVLGESTLGQDEGKAPKRLKLHSMMS